MSHETSIHPVRIPPPLEIVPDQWYAVLEAKELGERPVPIRRLGEELVLYRTARGSVACLVDRCPHRGAALHKGRVIGEQLACGYHGFTFRPDGACTSMPCDGPNAKIPNALRAQSFVTREAHGLIWIWWGATRQTYPEIPWINDLPSNDDAASDGGIVWPVPTFRAIESSFDYYHAPVLHGERSLKFSPIPRLRRFDEVECEADDERIEYKGVLRSEGEPAPDGVTIRCHTSFRMPGLAYIRIGSFLRIGVFDTPIDAATTWRFLRYVSTRGRAFGLGKLLISAERWIDMKIGTQFAEDLPMVTSQAHPVGDLHSDVYIKADVGIAQYHRVRRKLLRAAREQKNEYPPCIRVRLGEQR